MQKVQVYLYPNRITVLSHLDDNLANTEYRIVYQRTIKLYKGIDNVIELEVKNNDQKRVEIGLSQLQLVLMDQEYNTLYTYAADSLEDSTIVGLARITIPKEHLVSLDPQFLKFTVIKDNDHITYTNSNFDAYGTMELKPGVKPTSYVETIKYDRWTTETNYTAGRWEERKIYHISEAIPLDTKRSVPRAELSVKMYLNNFLGEVRVEGTDQEVIGNEAFKTPKILYDFTFTGPNSLNGSLLMQSLDITGCTYIRVKYRIFSSGSVDYLEVIV